MNCASLDKAQVVQAGPLFTQIEATSKIFTIWWQ